VSLTSDVVTERVLSDGIGYPALRGAPTTPTGWPGPDQVLRAVEPQGAPTAGRAITPDPMAPEDFEASTPDSDRVSRETLLAGADARSTEGVAGVAPTSLDAQTSVSRETSADEVDGAVSASTPADQVSRETTADALTTTLVEALPDGDADSPLAQAVAKDARRRITLAGRTFPRPAHTRVLTVANQKGGVGKTTTTVNLAAALAQAGATVLVIDLDPQGNASTALGIDHHAEIPSVYDALVDGTPLADVVQACPDVEGLSCVPATIDLAGAEIELVSLVARETRLAKAISAYLASPEGAGVDYVLIDCPPSLGLLTINAFVAAREVFIPIQCEYYALEGLSQLLKNIELIRNHLNPDLHVSSILLTMYDGRTRLAAQVADEVREHFPEQTFKAVVPRSVRISEAPSHGQTVMTYDPNSSGALSYLEAASEMADRGAAHGSASTEENA